MIKRMESAMTDDDGAKHKLWQDFAETTLVNAGLVEQCLADNPGSSGSEPDRPADAFLDWLKALVSADKSGIKNTADRMLNVCPSLDLLILRKAQPTKKMLPELKPNFHWLDPADWMPSRFENGLLDVGFLQSLVRHVRQARGLCRPVRVHQ